MEERFKQGMDVGANVIAKRGVHFRPLWGAHYKVECYDKNGKLKWVDEFDNLVVDEGLNDNLDKYFKGSNYTAAFYVGLTDGSPTPSASDTMSSHSGWNEVTAYSESARPTLTLGTVSNKSVDNSANKAQFTINADNTTIGGAFVTTDSTKGGTSGILYGVGAFSSGDKTLDNGDVLQVTITLTASAA